MPLFHSLRVQLTLRLILAMAAAMALGVVAATIFMALLKPAGPAPPSETEPDRALVTLVLSATLGLVIGTGLIWLLAGRVTRRLNELSQALQKVSASQLHEPIRTDGNDEISVLSTDISNMLTRIGGAYRSQEQFAAHVSHELKTPVTLMLSQAQLLKDRPASLADYRGFVHSVEDDARRMSAVIDTLLAMARCGQRFTSRTGSVISIPDLVVEALRSSDALARSRSVKLRLRLAEPDADQTEILVRGDFELLRVAIDNLVRNAIHASQPDQAVDIATEISEERCIIAVLDCGPGVPEAVRQRVLDLSKAQGNLQPETGSGLGLHITRAIVTLHEGELTAENRVPRGAKVTITLPRLQRSSEGWKPKMSETSTPPS